MNSTKLVIQNTIFLYGKMIISTIITLYSIRLVFNALGISDFGIFNLVSGIIAMLSFLNVAMTVSTQRFMSYFLGAGEQHKLKSIFHSSLVLHLIIGLIIIVILELAGVFLFKNFLNIPLERISTAKIIYQFMVVSMFFTINAVPFDSVINAHENMLFDSLTGIIESFLKLGIAIWLGFSNFDRLILYSFLIAVLAILIRIVKSIYCYQKYEECKILRIQKVDLLLLKEMFSFAGWNLFGSLASMGRNQGIAIIMNLFYGIVVNAAYGIANQVASQLNSFSAMMLKAINPQIMKSEGANDRKRMLRLAMMSSKYSFFLLALFTIPMIFEMPQILRLWLKEVPQYTIIFCDLILISNLTSQMTIGLQSAFQACGKIKEYQFTVGTLLLLNIPIAFLLLKANLPVYSVLISFLLIELIASSIRIILLKKSAGLSIKTFFNQVIFKTVGPIISSVFVCYVIVHSFNVPYRFFITGIASSIIFTITIFFTGLHKTEKDILTQLISKLIKRNFYLYGKY